MTVPGGDSGEKPQNEREQAPSEGTYEAPPIEQSGPPTGYEAPPSTPGYTGYEAPPSPPGYGGYDAQPGYSPPGYPPPPAYPQQAAYPPPGTPLENVEALCDAVDAVPTREPTP